MHIGEVALDKEKIVASSDSSSIGAHISNVTVTVVPSPRCVQDILVSYSYNNPMWAQTDPCNVLVDTINSVEDLVGAQFTDRDYDNLIDKEHDCHR